MTELITKSNILLITLLAAFVLSGCSKPAVDTLAGARHITSHEDMTRQCDEIVGEARVEKITDRVWVAISYDLANTVLIHTDDGNVIVDAGMSPKRAAEIKKALYSVVPQAPLKAIIYTHSHIDHIGGAVEWAEEGTQVWATDEFIEHFLKQYGMFRPAESRRGARQFGARVPDDLLPCSAIGRRIDYVAALAGGIKLPTHTFTGVKELEIGGVKIELHEAHGETHDQLFVWLPGEDTIISGDNFYWTFPNLYTIRGTSPRPVNDWIKSLDAIRRFAPEHLVPNHTKAVHGKDEIQRILTDYRDAIQWVRDEVVRGANRGDDIDTMAENIKLPAHLADKIYLTELYGQVDWSVRAIFGNEMGWFDGRAETLYPVPHGEAAKREIELMGGPDKVLSLAREAVNSDPRWAVHLLAKLQYSGLVEGENEQDRSELLKQAYMKLAEKVPNLNGRGYLIESAIEIGAGEAAFPPPQAGGDIVERVPLDLIFDLMSTRLTIEKSADIHEAVLFVFPDVNKQVTVTIRRGVAEVAWGDPLPGTPEPIATITVDSTAYRKIAMGITNPAGAFTSGDIKVDGSYTGLLKFMGHFKTGI